jgi:hypothetical protein
MQMVFEPEEGAEIDADDVIGDVRAAITPICDRDFGFAQRHDRAVDMGGSRTPIDACRVGTFPDRLLVLSVPAVFRRVGASRAPRLRPHYDISDAYRECCSSQATMAAFPTTTSIPIVHFL